jgi:MFS family permease
MDDASDTTFSATQLDVEKAPPHSDTTSASSHHSQHDMPNAVVDPNVKGVPTAPSPAMKAMIDPASFPDGGLTAWLCVFGAFCSLFASFGWINCIGVFQDYYQTHQLSEYSPSTVAWIPSLEVCIMFLGGSWVGRLYDNYGPRYIMLIGSFLHVFGLMMASISTKYYQFLLSQAACSSIGASMIFYPSFSVLATWFYKRRALVVGIASSGSGVGGIIFPIMVKKLVVEVGFGWALRICAFLILGLLILSNLFTKARIPPQPKPVKFMDFVRPLQEVSPRQMLVIARSIDDH